MTTHKRFSSCCIIGLGYIGLPTAVVVARTGMKVIGVDINKRVVKLVNAGQSPIEEPGLPEALSELVGNGLITASTEPQHADVYIIAVPTPFTGGYKPDLSYVEAATRSIATSRSRRRSCSARRSSTTGSTATSGSGCCAPSGRTTRRRSRDSRA